MLYGWYGKNKTLELPASGPLGMSSSMQFDMPSSQLCMPSSQSGACHPAAHRACHPAHRAMPGVMDEISKKPSDPFDIQLACHQAH